MLLSKSRLLHRLRSPGSEVFTSVEMSPGKSEGARDWEKEVAGTSSEVHFYSQLNSKNISAWKAATQSHANARKTIMTFAACGWWRRIQRVSVLAINSKKLPQRSLPEAFSSLNSTASRQSVFLPSCHPRHIENRLRTFRSAITWYLYGCNALITMKFQNLFKMLPSALGRREVEVICLIRRRLYFSSRGFSWTIFTGFPNLWSGRNPSKKEIHLKKSATILHKRQSHLSPAKDSLNVNLNLEALRVDTAVNFIRINAFYHLITAQRSLIMPKRHSEGRKWRNGNRLIKGSSLGK